MPSATKAHDVPTSAPSSLPVDDRADRENLTAVNAIVDRMRVLTSDDPYILTIPQDESRYQHSYQFQTVQWLDRTPFRSSEREKMQYQTFHFQEQGRDMFMLENSWTGAGDQALQRNESHDKAKPELSGNDTPIVKKMSLNAYKKKQAGGTPHDDEKPAATSITKAASVKGPVERLKAESEQVLAAVPPIDGNQPEPSSVPRASTPSQRTQAEKLNTTPKDLERQNARGKGTTPVSASRTSGAGIKTSQPSTKTVTPANKTGASTPVEDRSKLPPRLLPPRLSPLEVLSIPSKLSPTIPDNIYTALESRGSLDQSSESSAGSQIAVSRKRKASHLTNGVDSPTSKRQTPLAAQSKIERAVEDLPISQRKLVGTASGTAASTDQPMTSKREILVVKLKYAKHQREKIKRIIGSQTTLDKAVKPNSAHRDKSEIAFEPKARDVSIKGVGQKVGTNANAHPQKADVKTSVQEKRLLPTDDARTAEPPSKRIKSADVPSTPTQEGAASPIATSHREKSSQQVSPSLRRDHLSSAMKRELSTDSNMNTPSGRSTRTPAGHEKQGSTVARSMPSGRLSAKTPKQEAWESTQKRLETLGRDLKHAASSHLQTSGKDGSSPSSSTKDQKLAAVKSLESMLSYVLAFSCSDQAAGSADPRISPSIKPWRTLTAFYSFVKRNCEKFRPLSGLACLLGVAFSARILEISAQRPNDGPSRDSILETYNMLQRAATEADTSLSVDVIMQTFPQAWAARTSKGSLAGLSTLDKPGHFIGPFKLPVGLQTPPILVARASYAMLREWIDKQSDLDYQLELKLA